MELVQNLATGFGVAMTPENLFFAFIYNALGVPVAAGVLFSFFFILLSPLIAAAAMGRVLVRVVVNSLRLRRSRLCVGVPCKGGIAGGGGE